MSQLPRPGGSGKPLIKTTSTTTTKIPGGGSKTTTTTKIRELQPCTYGDRSKAQASGCQPCPSESKRSLRPPQAGAGAGLRPPSRQPAPPRGQPAPPRGQPAPPRGPPAPPRGQSAPPRGPPSRIPPPQGAPCRAQQPGPAAQPRRPPAPPQRAPARPRPPPPPVQMKPPAPGQYSVPAPYGPMSRAGKGMVFSSPADLRARMEAKVPKELKYEGIKICPGARAKDRADLPGTTMADIFSGSYNVYGGKPVVSEEMVGRNVLDERV